MRTHILTLFGAGMVSACVAVPVAPYAQQPLVAIPGPNKTDAAFAQDDAACRASTTAQPASTAGTAATPTAPGAAPAQQSPASVYYTCMVSRQNTLTPSPQPSGPAYAAYAAYPYGYPVAAYPYGYPYAGYYPGYFADDYFLDRGVGLYGFGGYYGGFGFRDGFRGGYGYGGRGGFARGGFGGGRGGFNGGGGGGRR